jgi:hypothetical protein
MFAAISQYFAVGLLSAPVQALLTQSDGFHFILAIIVDFWRTVPEFDLRSGLRTILTTAWEKPFRSIIQQLYLDHNITFCLDRVLPMFLDASAGSSSGQIRTSICLSGSPGVAGYPWSEPSRVLRSP